MPDDDNVDTPEVPAIDEATHRATLLENAMLRAGVELGTPRGDMVQQAWEGRTPDLEAIKAHWELVKPPEAPVEPLAAVEARIEGEQGQAEERRELSAQSVVEPNPEDVDPRKAAAQAAADVLAPPDGGSPGTRIDSAAAYIHSAADAAARGDRRVLVDEPAR